jgi:murein DD-endopeptidase MepM/ murein hydrolase activator NlpD
MVRRGALAFLSATLLAAAPAAGDPGADKARIDARIGSLRGTIARADARTSVLTTEITSATARIRSLQVDISAEQSRLAGIEAQLAALRGRLERLNARHAEQSRKLGILKEQHATSIARLEARVRQIYVEDTPDALSFVLEASSFSDLLDHVEFLNDIGRQDDRIARRVAQATAAMAGARAETARIRSRVADTTRVVAARVAEQRAARDRLVASRDALASARSDKRETLGAIRADRADFVAEVEAGPPPPPHHPPALAEKIRSSQGAGIASTGSGVSASGFLWPVHGAVVSGYGWRWGRMHEGVDISVASGTSVVAAASGTVIYAGWLGGYGNLVVVDHGNGLSTAYAHNSGFAVGVGASVGQGQTIAYSGSTGNSSGPHVHFAVRVNGAAVDPLGYL